MTAAESRKSTDDSKEALFSASVFFFFGWDVNTHQQQRPLLSPWLSSYISHTKQKRKEKPASVYHMGKVRRQCRYAFFFLLHS